MKPNPLIVGASAAILFTSYLSMCDVGAHGQSVPATSEANAQDDPKTHVAARGDLVLTLARDGRIDSANRVKVRLLPEAFSGPFEVAEVRRRGGRVSKGDVLIRFDGESLAKAIDDARVARDHAERRLAITQAEDQVLKEDNKTRLEQASKSRVRAAQELEIWEKYDSPDMLKQAELSMQQRENGLADARQELQQLEEMYSGTHLAQETKDIVLDRTRRDVKISEEYLMLSRNDDVVARQYRHPQRDEQVRDALRWAAEDEAHAKVGVQTSEDRKAMEHESAERAFRDAAERLEDLESDRGLLEVRSPADGVMTPIDLESRDNVNARQTVCEVLDPTDLIVKFSAHPEDLRILMPAGEESEQQVELRLPDFPEVRLTGTIIELAEMVSVSGGEANTIPVTVKISGEVSPYVRLGLRCNVRASRTLQDVLTVPNECVRKEGSNSVVKVVDANGQAQQREVVIGPANDKSTMIVEGLDVGDRVIVPAEGGK